MTFNRSSRPARLLAAAFATCLALGVALPAAAQWKWKDKSGRVQYSDLPPPPTVSDTDILQRPNGASLRKAAPAFATEGAASAVASAAPAGSGVDPELEAKRRKSSEEDAAKKRAEEEKQKAARAENCQRAKNQLRALEDGMRMARVNAKGEREVLDDKGRAEETKRARDVMASECK
jgi:hypothetical protein